MRRTLALLLALVLSFSLISEPLQAYAAITAPEPSAAPTVSEVEDPYDVGNDTRIFETRTENSFFTVVISNEEIPEDAILCADLLDPESDEYADAMLSAWISFGIDPEKDLFQMVPYDIYFTDPSGERFDYDGEATVTIAFLSDPFGGMEASRFISLMDGWESTKIEIDEIAENVIQFDVPTLSILSYAILEKAQLEPGSVGSIDALDDLPKDEVGAAYEVPEIHMLGMVGGDNWYFDIYYVGEDDYNYVELTNDFNLKYQIEVHVDQNYEPGEIEITIPKTLVIDRDGKAIDPTQIAVPEGDLDHPSVSPVTQFNYRIDGDDLVFFNYCRIESGTNNAWQVLYKNVNSMLIPDLSFWDLTATATVATDGGLETQTAAPLSGIVDTTAKITKVTKTPYSNTGTNYGPGLYTATQIGKYISGSLPEWCTGDSFSSYNYVLWKVAVSVSASQPYVLSVVDTNNPEGRIVGGKSTDRWTSKSREAGFSESKYSIANGVWMSESRVEEMDMTYYVVVAYPKETVSDGIEVENTVQFTVHPIDEMDEDSVKEATAKWKYEDYTWYYNGDTIGIEKFTKVEKSNNYYDWEHSQSFSGWLEVYKGLLDGGDPSENVSFPFGLQSLSRSFNLTHYTEGVNIGKRIDGAMTRIITVDDVAYAIPGDEDQEMTLLTGEDYYFESVKIIQKDVGYDVWEDEPADPEELLASETEYPGLAIYAMFADNNPTGITDGDWEYVDTVPWNDSGVLEYNFSPAQIARMPYRVKAIHDTINYSTTCDIYVDMVIRLDSPVMKKFLETNPDMPSVQFENIGGVMGRLMYFGKPYTDYFDYPITSDPGPLGTEDATNGWYHDYTISHGNYEEPGLAQFCKDLYNVLPMRYAALILVNPLEKSASAAKTHTVSNDVVNNRLNVTYNLTARDGWRVGSMKIGEALRDLDSIQSPGRNHVVFYDLMPYGMQYDPSSEAIAGRVTNIPDDEEEWVNPKSWDSSNVKVTTTVLDTNYKNTNRTLLKFDIYYTGDDDPSCIVKTPDPDTGLMRYNYFESWGVSFQGYYDWEDTAYSDKAPNVCVFMPAPGDSLSLLGAEGEVFDDDGNPPEGIYEEDYKLFGEDIDKDPATTEDCVLYAYELVMDDKAIASQSSIIKEVRADSNPFGTFEKSAVVDPGGGYTYKITVQNISRPIKDIVVFDRLENANVDRKGIYGELEFESDVWHGTFQGLVIDQLSKLGIQPVVYYNTRRNAEIPNEDGTELPSEVLTESNGWYKADSFPGSIDQVQAIAIDLSTTIKGEDFVLETGESISFRVQMKAPEAVGSAVWTYNNPSFYRELNVKTGTSLDQQLVIGNSVQVKYGDAKTLEVVKEFKGEIPPGVENDQFAMYLTEKIGTDTHKFADRVYTLWEKKGDDWVQLNADKVKTTGANGEIVLKAGQKAVFTDIPGGSEVVVEEEENPFWAVTTERTNTPTTYTITMQNEFKPVLYAMKKVEKLPTTERGKQALKDDVFKFQLLINNEPAKNIPYWYVTNVRTDGGVPSRVADKATGTTDENGYFTLKYGDIVAIIGSGKTGDTYTVKEVEMSENWLCEEDTKTGVLQLRGSSAAITNIYKWRSLILTKTLQHQDVTDAADVTFTFKVEKKNLDGTYSAVNTLNHWVMTNSYGTVDIDDGGNLNTDGTFSCNLAGAYVRIDDLEADQTYRITETSAMKDGKELLNILYEPLQTSNEWQMPLHSFNISGEYTNEWRLRPLYITKAVTYDEKSVSAAPKANAAVFTMKVEVAVDANENGKTDDALVPLANFPFQVFKNGKEILPGDPDAPAFFATDVNGTFTIKNGQTVYFKDVGLIGAQFRITETNSGTDFKQVFPTGNLPSEGKLARDGTESSPASFVNGMDSAIMLTKQYEMADENAQAYFASVKGLPAGENPLEVTITIRAFTNNGKTYIWPKEDAEVGIISEADSFGTKVTWEAGKPFNILPGQTVVLLNGINDDTVTTFNVTESSGDRQWMQVWTKAENDDYLIECTQTYPANGKAVTGQNGALKSIALVNTLSAHKPTGSAIMKDMVPGSDAIPNYERLTFIVEKKSGEDWIPAEGIPYYIGHYTHGDTAINWRNFEGEQTFETTASGIIEITKSENGYPFVQFLKDTVYTYGDPITPVADGTLRIREMLNSSDSSWGTFAWNSLLEKGEQFKPGWQADEGERAKPYDTIVNTNRTTKVRVGKTSSSTSNTKFTFYLNQVVDVDWSKATDGINENNYKTAIKSTLTAEGIEYYIWETAKTSRDTATLVNGPHIIGEDGKFTIEAGQYAEFNLPDKTVWTVSEEVTPGYYLDSMTTIEGMPYTVKLADNMTLISSAAGVAGDRLAVVVKQETWDPEAELDKSQFTVTYYDSDGKSKELNPDEFTIDPFYAPKEEGPFEVTITDNATGLSVTVTLIVESPYTVKYAVRIYGILTDDTDQPNKKAGLTFGPATNTQSYVNNKDGRNRCNHEGEVCISDLTWEEIIAQAETDPTVFQKCMEAGCVVSVPLNITGPLAGTSYKNQMDDGDGASVLYESIAEKYHKWNEVDSTGGWPSSRMRATLNGFQDGETDTTVAGTDNLTINSCLFAMFPEGLRNAIVEKAVTSDTIYNKYDFANQVTTYDKLWLFSGGEIYKYNSSGIWNDYLRINGSKITEGQQYPGNEALGITSVSYDNNISYNESGTPGTWWLRSLTYRFNYTGIVSNHGFPNCTDASYPFNGLAPGFCIGSLPAPYTTKYAVRIYGILVDDTDEADMKAGLTFGPATGENYTLENAKLSLCGQTGEACIANCTWAEIVAHANSDPTVFQKCMEAGCVVSVPLLITGKLANPDYTPQNLDNAAGISCIRRSVNPEYLMYAARHHKGWPSSFMRATLNGRDSRTDAVGEQYTILGSAECLLEMFPKVLKDNIVAKKVSSYCDVASYEGALLFKSYIQVTYDKLWLFSGGEIYPDIDNYNGVMEWEGPQYPCFKNKDFSIEDLQFLTPVDERGICKGRLRSIDISYKPSGGIADTYAVSHRDGHIVKAMCSDLDVGISPGFCVGSCYAPKSQTTKYAVRIYGINCDKYKDSATGQILTAGLTFGPATGEDYTHTHSGQNACGQSGKNCISNMTWEEIVEQSKNDPTIFQNCMEAGCVIPVDLNLIGSITVDEYPYDLSDGDGVGTLRYPISEEYMKWNNASDTTGGWPASRMRATLNGKDVQTDTTVAGSDCLTSDTCLLAAFPDVLRDSIVSKEVHSIAGNAVVISYDKLWLFSESELNKSSTNKDASPYPWAVKSFTSGTLYDPALVPYTETGNTADAWARDSSTFVVTRIPGGASGPSTYPPNMTIGISPGFCIP